MTSISIISINSPGELTGGGHYLRCLIKGYGAVCSKVNVFGKRGKINNFIFEKNISFNLKNKSAISDLFSRFLLCPSFILMYLFDICKVVKKSDVVAFHSSRLGVLIFLIHLIYPNKKIICHFDNVEYLLLKDKIKRPYFSTKYAVDIIDFFLIGLSEFLCCKFSSNQTFITSVDANYFSLNKSEIIPICYDKAEAFEPGINSNGYFLFTASFDFEPNVKALNELCQIAKNNKSVQFVAAGRGLSKFLNLESFNLTLYDSPTVEKMTYLFENAFAYITPVRLGSGMKTKVAEAMKHGLPIISTKESLVGYEDVTSAMYINVYDNIAELTNVFESVNNTSLVKSEIVTDFNKYYSIERVSSVLKRLLVCEKKDSCVDS